MTSPRTINTKSPKFIIMISFDGAVNSGHLLSAADEKKIRNDFLVKVFTPSYQRELLRLRKKFLWDTRVKAKIRHPRLLQLILSKIENAGGYSVIASQRNRFLNLDKNDESNFYDIKYGEEMVKTLEEAGLTELLHLEDANLMAQGIKGNEPVCDKVLMAQNICKLKKVQALDLWLVDDSEGFYKAKIQENSNFQYLNVFLHSDNEDENREKYFKGISVWTELLLKLGLPEHEVDQVSLVIQALRIIDEVKACVEKNPPDYNAAEKLLRHKKNASIIKVTFEAKEGDFGICDVYMQFLKRLVHDFDCTPQKSLLSGRWKKMFSGGIFGSLIGGLLGSSIPVLGNVAGAFVGGFVGVMIGGCLEVVSNLISDPRNEFNYRDFVLNKKIPRFFKEMDENDKFSRRAWLSSTASVPFTPRSPEAKNDNSQKSSMQALSLSNNYKPSSDHPDTSPRVQRPF